MNTLEIVSVSFAAGVILTAFLYHTFAAKITAEYLKLQTVAKDVKTAL
jgi:uncharacterized membrane protein affecting hemolysin expression